MRFTVLHALLISFLGLIPFAESRAQALDSLQVNRLKLFVDSVGNLGSLYEAGIYYPKGSNISSLYANGLWIGGSDPSDSLHLSNATYYYDQDFYPGPIADQYNANYDSDYQRVWKLNRDTLLKHDQDWWKSGYQVPDMISEWPAHGDTSNGEAHLLAKFKDKNGNGEYEPQKGDRPIMRGDHAIYFITNDLRGPHDSTDKPLGIEIHGMIYLFDCPNEPALEHSVLFHYEIINRSNTVYDSLMIGNWSDFDVGCSNDDYVGSDVERGIAFGYNGDAYDDTCSGSPGYGDYPAAIGNVFLKGPELEPNGKDDAWNGPGEGSVNGTGFDDGITDNEHWGMQHAYYYNRGTGPKGDPKVEQEYYYYMTGSWRDSTPITYGGDGYELPVTSGDTLARFMFPWNSDPKYYSSYGDTVPTWSEATAGNQPGDRRMIASTGPTTLGPGDTVELDMAYVVAQDSSAPNDSVAPVMVMKERVDSLRSYFLQDAVPCSDGSFSSIQEKEAASFEASVFPNPSDGRFHVGLKGKAKSYKYRVYSMRGELLQEGEWKGTGRRSFSLDAERSGVHFLRIRSEGSSKVLKVVKE